MAPRNRRRPPTIEDPHPSTDTITVETAEGTSTNKELRETATNAAKVRAFLDKAIKRFQSVIDAESDLRAEMMEDRRFEQSDHWDKASRDNRQADGRPCLTVNHIPQYIRQIANGQRASRPSIAVDPANNRASMSIADVLRDMVRTIERGSDADVAYSTACEQQLTMGRGYFRILTEYAADDGFDQVIVLRRIPNAFSVYEDPDHVQPEGQDGHFKFIVEDVPVDRFENDFGKAAITNSRIFEGAYDATCGWGGGDTQTIRIAEYWYKEIEKEEFVEVEFVGADGIVVRHSMPAKDVPKPFPATYKETNRRIIEHVTVKWAKITGFQILEGNNGRENNTEGRVWPGSYIPIVPVIGDEAYIDGKRNLRGMVRDARDPARMISFWMSALTELIAISPRAPYIGYAGQFKGHETKWNQAHLRNFPFLEVAHVTVGGQLAPIPARQPFAPDISAVVAAFQLSDTSLKNAMGMYNPSLGQAGPETSGRQVLALQKQAELGTSNYSDNLARSVRLAGRIVIDLIPKIYTPSRILRVLGETGSERRIAIGPVAPDKKDVLLKAGIEGVYDISVGRYDVSVSARSNPGTKRQEAVESMLQLIRMYPDAAPLIADLLVQNMDWPDAPKVAERLRSMVPPHILDPGPLPPQVAAMIQKMQNAYQELQKAVDTDAVKAASNERIKKAEMEAKIRIAAMENLVRLMQTEAKINADRAIQLTQAEIDRAQAMLEALATPPVEEAAPPVPPPGIAPPGPEAAPPAPADVAPTMQ